MGKKPKTHRYNAWKKDEEKLRKLREQLQRKQQAQPQPTQPHQATENQQKPTPSNKPLQTNQQKPTQKLTKEKLADIITAQLKEDPEIRQLAEQLALKLAQKLIAQLLPDITEKVLNALIREIQNATLQGTTIEIRGLATWKPQKGKIKVKNHIKPKDNQP